MSLDLGEHRESMEGCQLVFILIWEDLIVLLMSSVECYMGCLSQALWLIHMLLVFKAFSLFRRIM